MTIANSPATRQADWRDEPRDAIGTPLLARIPDVSTSLRSLARPANLDAALADLRIDPPVVRGLAGRHGPADRSRSGDSALGRKRLGSDREEAWRRAETRSRVLPSGNPFEIPRERLHDKFEPATRFFAPVARFMLMFALFTTAGTSLMMIGRAPQLPAGERARPPVATVNPTIAVPTGMEQTAVTLRSIDVMAPDTRTIPPITETETLPAVARTDARISPYFDPSDSPVAEEDLELHNDPADETSPLPYPTTKFLPARLPSVNDGPLPQVRTTDAPLAVARRSGDVERVPPR